MTSPRCARGLVVAALAFLATAAAPAAELKTSTFGGLVARPIGPAVTGGRIADLVATPTDPSVLWVGAASGGLWRSKDGGITFAPVFDQQPVQSIGAIGLDPKDPQTIWVGTGEPWTRNSTSVGNGVYKSTDSGDTWQNVGLGDSERIDRVIVDPKDSKTVWVCAVGHLWNANPERGVFKSSDAGKSWEKVLFVDDDTGCGDLSLDPQDPRIAYASMWQFRRYPWAFSSGGKGSGLYRTMDGGKTWSRLSEGLPKGNLGRIALAVAPSRTSVVYATVEAKDGTYLYRSDDLGNQWQQLATSLNVSVRPFYFSRLVVDPTDWQRVYKPGLTLSLSRDGGKSFNSPMSGGFSGGFHGDLHALWIDPRNAFRILIGTDGGVYESLDRGGHWRHLDTLPVSQVYRVAYDNAVPYNVYVGLQDNGSWMGPSRAEGGVRNRDWRNIGFGDGFWAFPDLRDDDTVYSEMQAGGLFRFSRRSGEIKQIAPFPQGKEPKLRFNWNTAYTSGPSGNLYVGAQYLFRSKDQGESWERISSDLTTNDPLKQKQGESGGLTVDNSSAENHTTIYAIAESPKNPDLLWVGTDDGNLQLSRDGGKSWTNVAGKVPGLPKNTWVSNVEASPFAEGTAFATFDGHRGGDMKTYVYETTDFGQTWRPLAGEGVDGYAHVIRQDPTRAELLYLGTEMGLSVSIDGGAHWARFDGGLPRVPVMDLKLHPRDGDLIVGTHGRGVWIVDDLSPLRALTPEVMESDFALLPGEDGVQTMSGTLQDFPGDDEYQAGNPPEAAPIFYYLKKRHVMGDFKVDVYDAAGKKIITLPAGGRVGINQVPWPMRFEAPKIPAGNEIAPATVGPFVPEGTYTYKVTKGDQVYEGKVRLVADPRSPYSAEDRALQQKTALAVYHDLEDLTYLTETVVDLHEQAQARAKSAGEKDAQSNDGLRKRLTAFAGELEALRQQLTSSSGSMISGEEKLREHMSSLYAAVTGYLGKPTGSQLARVPALESELAERRAAYDKLNGSAIAGLNRDLASRKLAPLAPLTREAWEAKKSKGGGGSGLGEWPRLPVR
ncbi:MAG TPA: glycosyl hydrolase [Thermoanaerobaculia bacterium]|jgi:photosystem II stability/assembly factor-like uncharacterized protein|nr:glycosyl hydrolase [Thermoanaerobaculia bacterium]